MRLGTLRSWSHEQEIKLFSPEERERAVREVLEHPSEYPSRWATIEFIAPKIGCVSQAIND